MISIYNSIEFRYAARGLPKLLPPIKVGYDPDSGLFDPYNRDGVPPHTDPSIDADGENTPCEERTHAVLREISTPFVDLPIGSTEDRVLGSIDFSATLKGGGTPRLLARPSSVYKSWDPIYR